MLLSNWLGFMPPSSCNNDFCFSKIDMEVYVLPQVRALNFSAPVYAPPVLLPTATQPASVRLGVDGAVKGELPFIFIMRPLEPLQKYEEG